MAEDKNIPGEKSEDQISPANNPATEKVQQPDENISQQLLTPITGEQPGTVEPETINSSSDDTGEAELKQETLQSQTDMEVPHHHHAHHSKTWKDYLYEFLMLFLAVTAGFFVENQREHYIERERAKKFSKQLLADLRLDSALFENRNRDMHGMQKGHDNLINLLTKRSDATDKEILETLLPLTFVFDLPVTATTYIQMKTSGSLRYIEKMDLTAHLQHYYDVLLPRSVKIAEASLNYYTQHINPFYLKHIRIQDYDPFNDTLVTKDPVITGRTRETDQELANIMGNYRSLLTIQTVTMNEPALNEIKEIMLLLKKEYNLK
jgi:hypothetical protein